MKVHYKANESEMPTKLDATFFDTINIIMLLLEKKGGAIHGMESREKSGQI